MKFQFTIRDLLLVMMIAALAAGWWMDHQRINRINQLPVQQWDYQVVQITTGITGRKEPELARIGSEGWEIISVQEANNSAGLWLKRPKR
jgi:hypothetical protein